MPQAATIKSLPRAFRMMKVMQPQGIGRGEDYRRAAGDSLIAATALRHGLGVVTRNTADFRFPDLDVVNPWDEVA